MKIQRTLTVIVGVTQSMIAMLTIIFACILYSNVLDVQTWLNATEKSQHLHTLTLFGFGFFSLISGLFLVYEWSESR